MFKEFAVVAFRQNNYSKCCFGLIFHLNCIYTQMRVSVSVLRMSH